MTRMTAWFLSFVFSALAISVASATEIKVLCPRGAQNPVTEAAEAFMRETGNKVQFMFGTAGGLQTRAVAGKSADVLIVSSAGIEELMRRGTVVPGTWTDLGRVGVGVAVRAGAPLPDISAPEALKQAVLAARSLGYADPARGGQGGTHFARVLERLGIADTVKSKTVLFPEGTMALERVAKGELEMGVAPVSEIVTMKGLALVGPLPGDLQNRLSYSAGLLTISRLPETARAFVRFLTSPSSRAKFSAAGFEPPE